MSATPKSGYSLLASCPLFLSCRVSVVICLSFAAATVMPAALRPARIFSDHMVLQQDLPVPVWGSAEAGQMVVVEFAGQSVQAKASDAGRWQVRLEPMQANSRGRMMQVRSSAADPVVIRDVLVGEVWFSGGQSNMAYTTGQMAGRLAEGRALVEAANMKGIRLRKINERDSPLPKDDLAGGSWEVCSPQSVGRHSAVAFVFARRLHRELGVPVGIIDCSWGGTPIEPYIPADAFTGHPTLEKLAALAKTGDIEAVRRLSGGTFARSPAWLAGAIYNGRIAPVAPYAIRGAIWYQGESNSGRGEDPRMYAHKMRALMRGWRNAWGRGDLPLYFVQLPQWKSYAWTYLREEQLRALDQEYTGMAVTIDLDNAGDIHPSNKIDVGERLARWPLAKVYGREVACSGPLYRGISVRGNTLIVDFHHAEGGLMTGSIDGVGKLTPQPDAALNGFEVSGKDGKWHVAKAKIQGSSVAVFSPVVQQPVALRYACHPQAPAGSPWNLYSREGLPASPFCSDWNRMPYDPARNPMPE
jgi:sialate O-acetylesterase